MGECLMNGVTFTRESDAVHRPIVRIVRVAKEDGRYGPSNLMKLVWIVGCSD
jgi:hypothetical protein